MRLCDLERWRRRQKYVCDMKLRDGRKKKERGERGGAAARETNG